VVDALSALAPELAPSFTLRIRLRFRKCFRRNGCLGQCAACAFGLVSADLSPARADLTLPGVNTSTWPVLLSMSIYYLLAFDDSRVVIGATREEGTGMDLRLTAGGVTELLNAGLKIAPGLPNATLGETCFGLRPMPGAAAPIYEPAPGIDNLYIGNRL